MRRRPNEDPRAHLLARAVPLGDCLVLPGTTRYARTRLDGRSVYAHRLVLGVIPRGHEVHHLCGVTRCIRPEHLQVIRVTEHRAANARRLNALRWHSGAAA